MGTVEPYPNIQTNEAERLRSTTVDNHPGHERINAAPPQLRAPQLSDNLESRSRQLSAFLAAIVLRLFDRTSVAGALDGVHASITIICRSAAPDPFLVKHINNALSNAECVVAQHAPN